MSDHDDLMPENKAQMLALAAAVVPLFRGQSAKSRKRRVTLVDKEGKITGYTTLGKVQEALLEQHKIETQLQPEMRPKEVVCKRCGLPTKVAFEGREPQFCGKCKSAKCSRCHKPLAKSSTQPYRNAKRKGAPVCTACRTQEAIESRARVADCPCLQSPPMDGICSLCRLIRCKDCNERVSYESSKKWLYRQRTGSALPGRPRCTACHEKAVAEGRIKVPQKKKKETP